MHLKYLYSFIIKHFPFYSVLSKHPQKNIKINLDLKYYLYKYIIILHYIKYYLHFFLGNNIIHFQNRNRMNTICVDV